MALVVFVDHPVMVECLCSENGHIILCVVQLRQGAEEVALNMHKVNPRRMKIKALLSRRDLNARGLEIRFKGQESKQHYHPEKS